MKTIITLILIGVLAMVVIPLGFVIYVGWIVMRELIKRD